MRVKVNFSQVILDFEKSKKKSAIVTLYPGKNTKLINKPYDKNTPLKVRLVRIDLSKENVEILITSLLEAKRYATGIFKKLYQKRWGVETFYDELKNRLKVEHFSGYSNQSIQQDFYATLFVSNIQTMIVSELEDEIAEQNQKRKYDYKINTNISYGLLKNRILDIFFSEQSSQKAVENIKLLFLEHQVPIRPNRSFERKSGKYRNRLKPKVTKNQKDTI